jgi:uncharacterized membrane protein
MHSLDLRTMLLARHAQHVVLIHFPIALFIAAVAFDYVSHWTRNQALARAAYFNLVLAAASIIPVLATGLLAWHWALEGQKLKGILLFHLLLGCAVSVLIGFVLWVHLRARRRPNEALPRYRLPIEAFGVLLVALTGHLGGVLSGVTHAG